jgi:hypothetical protein
MAFKPDQEFAKQRLAHIQQELENGVSALASADSWKTYLTIQARFHKYSFNNTMLIVLQYPDATRVAGMRTWNKLNRKVQKGQKGIVIFAPRFGKKEVEKADGTVEVKEYMYYTTVSVFDISQTEILDANKPDLAGSSLVASDAVVKILDGDEWGFLLERLVAFSSSVNGCPVSFIPMNNANGCYWLKPSHRIEVKSDNPINQQVKTLIHEIAHSMLHSDVQDRVELDRADRELEAESVAYIVSKYMGFDTSEYSFGYLAGWAAGNGKDFQKKMQELGVRVQKAAATIIEAITPNGKANDETDEEVA